MDDADPPPAARKPIKCPVPRCKGLLACDRFVAGDAKAAAMPFVMLMCTVFLVFATMQYYQALLDVQAQWPEATCEVGTVNVHTVKQNKVYVWVWDVDVTMRTPMDGIVTAVAHRWATYRIGDTEEAESRAAAPAEGASVPCWYDPAEPTKVKLDDTVPDTSAIWTNLIIVVVMVVFLIPFTLWMFVRMFETYGDAYNSLPDDPTSPPRMLKPQRSFSGADRVITITRSNSHFWHRGEIAGGAVDASIRHGFIRKVYGIVLAQVVLTGAVAFTMMRVEPLAAFSFANWWWLSWVTTLSTFGLLLGCFFYKNEYPTNYLLLFGFTLIEAYTVGVVCAVYKTAGLESTVLQAFLLTAGLFVALTLFAMQSRVEWSFLGAGLYGSLYLLIAAGLLGMLLRSDVLLTAYALAGAMCFCLFIIYDTYLITRKLGYDDYIVAAIELYLDILNLFLFLLSLLGRRD